MALVLGIDQSATSTGVCLLKTSGELVHLSRICPTRGLKDTARLLFIRDSLTELLSQYSDITTGVMEGYSYGSANKKFVLGEVGAVVKIVAADADIDLKGAAPTQLKKFVTGHGSATKQEVIKAIERRWKIAIPQDDMADAYGLARIALEIKNPTSLYRAELEIIKKITNKALHKKRVRSRISSFSDAV